MSSSRRQNEVFKIIAWLLLLAVTFGNAYSVEASNPAIQGGFQTEVDRELFAVGEAPTDYVQDATGVLRSRFVVVNSALLHDGNMIQLNLFDDVTYTAVLDSASTVDGVFSWQGHLQDIEDSEVYFAENADGIVVGAIGLPGEAYEILYAGEDVNELKQFVVEATTQEEATSEPFPVEQEPTTTPTQVVEVEPTVTEESQPEPTEEISPTPVETQEPTVEPTGEITETVVPTPTATVEPTATATEVVASSQEMISGLMGLDGPMAADDGSVVDVAVVYTTAAKNAAGGKSAMDSMVNLMFQETNQSFINSNIQVAGQVLRLRQVYKGEVTYTESGTKVSGGELLTDLSRLRNTGDGYLEDVHTIRDAKGADIVVMVLDDGVGACSQAYRVMNPVSTAFVTDAFAVVDLECATGNYSFAFAIGQLMSARADWEYDWRDNMPFTHNHGYVNVDEKWYTIMGLPLKCENNGVADCVRIQYWSDGGTNGRGSITENNVLTLQLTASTVAQFRSEANLAPPDTSLISPADEAVLSDNPVALKWNIVDTANGYHLVVSGPTSADITCNYSPDNSVTDTCAASNVICDVDTGDCTYESSFSDGSYTWQVQTLHSTNGNGGTVSADFQMVSIPGQPTVISPSGNTAITQPTYSWSEPATGGSVDTYQILVSGSTSVDSGWITASCSGGTCSYTPGTNLNGGAHSWTVQAKNGGGTGDVSTVGNFTVTVPDAPTGLSSNGSTNFQPTYQWNAVSGATHYTLYLDGPGGNLINTEYTTAEVGCSSGTGTCSLQPAVNLTGGSHTWKIQARNSVGSGSWSSDANFESPAPGQVSLSSPNNGAVFTTSPQSFSWNAVTGATGYEVEISPSGGIASINITGTSAEVTFNTGSVGAYSWHVRATNNNVSAGDWSTSRSFDIAGPDAPTVTVKAPAGTGAVVSNGGTIYYNNPGFTWGAVSGTNVTYQLIVKSAWDGGTTYSYDSGWITALSDNPDTLSGTPGTYNWSVQSKSDWGDGGTSSGTFITSPPVSAPGMGSASPAVDEVVYTTSKQFSWGAVSGENVTGYDVQWRRPDLTIELGYDNGSSTSPTLSLNSAYVGDYYWRVQARNPFGVGPWTHTNDGVPTSWRHFSTSTPLAPASLTNPSSPVVINNPVLSWASVQGTNVQYQVTISGPSYNETSNWISGTSLTLGTNNTAVLTSAGSYTWEVQAQSAFGVGGTKTGGSFTVQGPAAPTVTVKAPASTGSTVSDGGTIYYNNPGFTWPTVSGTNVVYQLIISGPGGYSYDSGWSAIRSYNSIPALSTTPGTYNWTIQSKDDYFTGGTASGSFITAVPVASASLTNPSSPVYITNPTLSWSSVAGTNVQYEVTISGPSYSATSDPISGTSLVIGTNGTTALTNAGAYTWSVKTINYFGEGGTKTGGSFTASTVVAPTVTVKAPASTGATVSNGSTIYYNNPGFTWPAVTGTNVQYRLTITGPSYSYDSGWTTSTSHNTITALTSGNPGTYNWSVATQSDLGGSGGNASGSFITAVSPAPSSLTDPASPVTITNPTLSWSSVAGTNVEYQVVITGPVAYTATSNWISGTSLQIGTNGTGQLNETGDYTWEVTARNVFGTGGTNSSGSFTVDGTDAPTVTVRAPGSGGSIVTNGGTTYYNNPNFRWTAVSGTNVTYRLIVESAWDGGSTYTYDTGAGYTAAANTDYTVSPVLPTAGSYNWSVQSSSDLGLGDTATGSFTAAVPQAPTVTVRAPASTGSTVSNGGTIYFNNPGFTWPEVAGTNPQYRLTITGPGPYSYDSGWASTRSYNAITALTSANPGTYNWSVETQSDLGVGASATGSFDTAVSPAPASLTNPSSPVAVNNPTLSWSTVGGTTVEYQVSISGPSYSETSNWVSGTSLVIGTNGTALLTNTGSYTWQVTARNVFGTGGTKTGGSFTSQGPAAPTVTVRAPSGGTSISSGATIYYNSVSFSWPAVSGSNPLYQLIVLAPGGGTLYDSGWSSTRSYSNINLQVSPGTYNWTVQSKDDSFTGSTASGSFTTAVSLAPASLTNPSPPVDINDPVLSWSAVAGSNVEYQVEISGPGYSATSDWISTTSLTLGTNSTAVVTQAGAYTWQVNTRNYFGSGDSKTGGSFTTVVPGNPNVTTQPAAEIYINNPSFAWDAISGSDVEYRLQVSGPGYSFDTGWTTTRSWTVSPLLTSTGTYNWTLDTRNTISTGGSDSGSFDVVVPQAPSTLTDPTPPVDVNNPTLSWSAVTGTTVQYQVSISGPSYNETSNWISGTSLEIGTNGTATISEAGAYTWEVTARSVFGTGGTKTGGAFTIVTPGAPNVTTQPAATIYVNNPSFAWDAISGSDVEYQLIVSGPNGYNFDTGWVTTRSFTVSPLLSDVGSYNWSVQSRNTVADGGTTNGSFEVAVSVAPATLTDPASPVYDTNPTLSWASVAGTTVEYQVVINGPLYNETSNWVSGNSLEIGTNGTDVLSQPGAYTWEVTARSVFGTGGTKTGGGFTTSVPQSAPTLSSPTSDQVIYDETYTFSWNAVIGATGYEVEITPSTGVSIVYSGTIADVTFTNPGDYKWRARASNAFGDGDWSAVDAESGRAFTVSAPVSAPNLTTPTVAANIYETPYTFNWDTVTGATGYELEITPSTGVGITYSGNSAEVTFSSAGAYKWRVKANNIFGDGPWSAADPASGRSFSVTVPTASPSLTSPANGITNYQISLDLEWDNTPLTGMGIIGYDLDVSTSPTGDTDPLNYTNVTGTSHTLTFDSDDAGVIYYWRVRAKNNFGASASWSSIRSFTVEEPVVVPDDGNRVPVASSTETETYYPEFQWTHVEGATRYYLIVSSPDPINPWITMQYDAATACPGGVGTVCTVNATQKLDNGPREWKVQSWSPIGYGSESTSITFYMDITPGTEPNKPDPPSDPQLQSPSGTTRNTRTPIVWQHKAGENLTHFDLYIKGPSGLVLYEQFAADGDNIVCDGSGCTFTLPNDIADLAGGTYTVYLRSWNKEDYPLTPSQWCSIPLVFTVIGPETAVPTAPIGSDGPFKPAYTWDAVNYATWYNLVIVGPNSYNHNEWYQAGAVCTDNDGDGRAEAGDTCTYNSGDVLRSGGNYSWYVRSYSSGGHGSWSSETAFTVSNMGTPSLLSPAQDEVVNSSQFTWYKLDGATWYRLNVVGPTGTVVDSWYSGSDTNVCPTAGTTCSISPSLVLLGGSYTWTISAYNPAITNPSVTRNFTVEPLTPTLNAIGATKNTNPVISWTEQSGATSYQLYVTGPTGAVIAGLTGMFTVGDQVSCSTGTCEMQSPVALNAGSHKVWIKAWGAGTSSSWSGAINFSIVAPDTVSTMTSPSGSGSAFTPTYEWDAVDFVTHYKLYVSGPSGALHNEWHLASDICTDDNLDGRIGSGDTCQFTPEMTLLSSAHYRWLIQTWSTGGYGPWTSAVDFSVEAIAVPTLDTPANLSSGNNALFKWSEVSGASWYRLVTSGPEGNGFDNWYRAGEICASSSCTVVPSVVLVGGTYNWFVQAYNPGLTTTSSTWSFDVEPDTPTLTPLGTSSNTQPVISWTEMNGATEYELLAIGNNGNPIVALTDTFPVTGGDVNCSAGVCSLQSPAELPSGTNRLFIRALGNSTASLWSTYMSFTITGPPSVTNLTSPSGSGIEFSPTYTWEAVNYATYYRLNVGNATGTAVNIWYVATDICTDGNGDGIVQEGDTCSATPDIALNSGTAYQWAVETWSTGGYGEWSSKVDFTVSNISTPLTGSPSGEISDNTPEYIWDKIDGTHYYQLVVTGSSGDILIGKWYGVYDSARYPGLTCNETQCSVTPATALTGGTHKWKVRAYNPGGSEWSDEVEFLVQPATPVLSAPIGTITDTTPTFNWAAVTGATEYYLYVSNANGVVPSITNIYSSTEACENDGDGDINTCAIPATEELAGGTYSIFIQARNDTTIGTWSPRYQVLISSPSSPSAFNAPSGSNIDQKPLFDWGAVDHATWYQLYVVPAADTSTPHIREWYFVDDICTDDNLDGVIGNGDTCSIQSEVILSGDTSYRWFLMSYSAAGYSGWAEGPVFSTKAMEKTTLSSPSGTIVGNQPVYTWSDTGGAEYYGLVVNGTITWFRSANICTAGTCTRPSEALIGGNYQWYVRSYTRGHYGPDSDPMDFVVNPLAPVLASPLGRVPDLQPTFSWAEVASATHYYLNVVSNGQFVDQANISKLHEAGAICSGGTCSVTTPNNLAPGTYSIWVRAQNGTVISQWSNENVVVLGAPSLVSPLNTNTTSNPTFSWNAVDGQTYYRLYIYDIASNADVYKLWHTTSSLGCTTTCSLDPGVSLTSGKQYRWYIQSYPYGYWSDAGEFTVQ